MGEFLDARDSVTGKHFLPDVQEVVTWLRDGLAQRMEPLFKDRVYMLATMCDPCLKDGLCGQNSRMGGLEILVGQVQAAWAKRLGQTEAEEQDTLSHDSTPCTNCTPSRSTGQDFWAKALQAVVGQRGNQPTRQDAAAAATTVQCFLAECMEDCSIDFVAYWSSHSHFWPNLARVARDHLSCPPTSVPSKRVFSMTMWLNEGLQCAAKAGFNYSNLCDNSFHCKSQEQQQKTLHDICAITTTFSDSRCKSSSLSAALLGTVWVFLTSGVLLSFFFLIFTIHFRKNRIVKMSSPNLNVVTLLGSGLTYCSIFLFGIEKQNSLTRSSMEMLVQARICLLCIGVTLTLGPILGKSWRLHKVFIQQVPDKRVIIKDFQLLLTVSILVLADILLLLVWIFLDPVQCLQYINAELKVTENGLTFTVNRGYYCSSLYSDLWLILFVGFKGILLMYGAYLAGLTYDLSCPPVNQSLTLIVGIAVIFLSTGIMLVVNRFFHLWHNLVFGFISGGIFFCASTINCLIFIPQVRQWKALKNPDISNMAKYFTSSGKNFHSTMYSDEEIYQLLGEKNAIMQQLVEKDTAIASLQEQVNNAKEKLMRLMAEEDGCNAVDSPSPPASQFLLPLLQQAHSTANCSSITDENSPSDSFSPGQESRQHPGFSKSQCRLDLFSKKGYIDYLDWTNQQNTLTDFTTRYRQVNGCKLDDYSSVKHTLSMGTLQNPFRQSLSRLSKEAKKTYSSPMSQKQLQRNCENLQAFFQELSMNHSTTAKTSSRGPEKSADCEMSMVWQPQEMQANFMKFSPYKTRQEKKIATHPSRSMDPNMWCNADKTSSRMQKSCSGVTEFPWAAASNTDSDSNSSCGVTNCHHRQCCKVCHCSLSSSSDSCSTDTDPEPSMALGHCVKLCGRPQLIVNFNEDLEPTYV
ncbi:probable G-protein coupled receptor 156 [Elgaria multicarinata webbii]|uniref:probable G-protein coupled receptor 156 n=1 Tax=Elgaria multicarinata webbii TaxID=159646 RepID=UPI002FCD1F73